MPDLTVVTLWSCMQNEAWSTTVHGSDSAVYTVRWAYQFSGDVQYKYECTCPAFKFGKGKECKHILKVCGQRCNWTGTEPWKRPATEWEQGMLIHAGDEVAVVNCCPQCKGPVKAIQEAV